MCGRHAAARRALLWRAHREVEDWAEAVHPGQLALVVKCASLVADCASDLGDELRVEAGTKIDRQRERRAHLALSDAGQALGAKCISWEDEAGPIDRANVGPAQLVDELIERQDGE